MGVKRKSTPKSVTCKLHYPLPVTELFFECCSSATFAEWLTSLSSLVLWFWSWFWAECRGNVIAVSLMSTLLLLFWFRVTFLLSSQPNSLLCLRFLCVLKTTLKRHIRLEWLICFTRIWESVIVDVDSISRVSSLPFNDIMSSRVYIIVLLTDERVSKGDSNSF